MVTKFWRALARRRTDTDEDNKSEMARIMGLFDLTTLGVGATLGLGIYVLAAKIAKDNAGPAVCISFAIAAVASALAGVCYAEFASRVPKSGSAYAYSYVTVGEFIAFIIGWNLIFEYIVGTAGVASGFSHYVDNLLHHIISENLKSIMPINSPYLTEYPDVFAFTVVMVLTVLLCIGAKESSYMNRIFGTVNVLTILTVIFAGIIKANPANWSITVDELRSANITNPKNTGGFMPFGVEGIIKGAALSFFGFVGFDSIASCGEEAKNPKKNVPLAIVISLFVVFVAYVSIAIGLTLMWPYYDQNTDAAFPYVFEKLNWPVLGFIVNIGGIFALSTSLVGGMFPLPRILYAMGSDGIIFKCFGKINSKTQTPILGTIISGSLIGMMTLIFNLDQLIDMASIGTLLAYTIVAMSVLILRYQVTNREVITHSVSIGGEELTLFQYFIRIFNMTNQKVATNFTSMIASWGVLVFAILAFVFAGMIINLEFDSTSNNTFGYIISSIIGIATFLTMVAIGRQPTAQIDLTFKVPFVPFVPCCSIFINLLLMLRLSYITWIRFAVWMIMGFAIYFSYGIKNSIQGFKDRQYVSSSKYQKTTLANRG